MPLPLATHDWPKRSRAQAVLRSLWKQAVLHAEPGLMRTLLGAWARVHSREGVPRPDEKRTRACTQPVPLPRRHAGFKPRSAERCGFPPQILKSDVCVSASLRQDISHNHVVKLPMLAGGDGLGQRVNSHNETFCHVYPEPTAPFGADVRKGIRVAASKCCNARKPRVIATAHNAARGSEPPARESRACPDKRADRQRLKAPCIPRSTVATDPVL